MRVTATCTEAPVPGPVIVTVPVYFPAVSPVVLAVKVTVPGVVPEAGCTVSQLPPEVVCAVEAICTAELPADTLTVCCVVVFGERLNVRVFGVTDRAAAVTFKVTGIVSEARFGVKTAIEP